MDPLLASDNTPEKQSEQGHKSELLKKETKVIKNMQSLEEANGDEPDEVKKTSAEHEVSTSKRRKIACPLVACKANVVHLPRHMRNVHHWTKEAASKVLLKYNIRKRLNKEPKKKDYRCRGKCPIGDCHSIVQRLPKHLQKVHKLNKASKEYNDAIENAPVAPNRKACCNNMARREIKEKDMGC